MPEVFIVAILVGPNKGRTATKFHLIFFRVLDPHYCNLFPQNLFNRPLDMQQRHSLNVGRGCQAGENRPVLPKMVMLMLEAPCRLNAEIARSYGSAWRRLASSQPYFIVDANSS
jgi:hypothetical protein